MFIKPKLIENELRRIAKEIGETLNNGCEETKQLLIYEAVQEYELTKEEEIRLNVLLANCR